MYIRHYFFTFNILFYRQFLTSLIKKLRAYLLHIKSFLHLAANELNFKLRVFVYIHLKLLHFFHNLHFCSYHNIISQHAIITFSLMQYDLVLHCSIIIIMHFLSIYLNFIFSCLKYPIYCFLIVSYYTLLSDLHIRTILLYYYKGNRQGLNCIAFIDNEQVFLTIILCDQLEE